MPLQPPFPSTDGKKVFVVGRTSRGELARYNSQSGRFEPFLGGISAEYVDFSHDGQWVAYVTFPDQVLWRSKVDGSERLQLTYPPSRPYVPRWSPDGKTIAFFDGRHTIDPKIYTVSSEGGSPRPLLPDDPALRTISTGRPTAARLFSPPVRWAPKLSSGYWIWRPIRSQLCPDRRDCFHPAGRPTAVISLRFTLT
jgi:hypothetical protein